MYVANGNLRISSKCMVAFNLKVWYSLIRDTVKSKQTPNMNKLKGTRHIFIIDLITLTQQFKNFYITNITDEGKHKNLINYH